MTLEVVQQIIKRGGGVVLVGALLAGGYFVYDMMYFSSSDTVVNDDSDDRGNLDDFLGTQTGATASSGSEVRMVQTGSRSGGTLEREGEVVSNIVVGSGDLRSLEDDLGSGDVMTGGSGRMIVEDVFDQLLAGLSLSGSVMNQSGGYNNMDGSGDIVGSTGAMSGGLQILGLIEGGYMGGSGSGLLSHGVDKSLSTEGGGIQQSDASFQSGDIIDSIVLPVSLQTGEESIFDTQSVGSRQSGPMTLPVSEDRLMEHYRQWKKTQ